MTDIPMTQELAKAPKPAIAMSDKGVELRTLDDAYRFAQYVVKSGLTPKGIDSPEKALIAMQAGAELGFSPMRSLACITVINGRAGLYGDAALAKIHESNLCSKPPVITTEGQGDERKGVVRFQRKNMPAPVEVTFSVAEAKKAKLWGKQGPWTDYQDTMLGWRAVSKMAKQYFGDILMGLVVAEELHDYPAIEVRATKPPIEPDPLLAEVVVASPEPNPYADRLCTATASIKAANTIVGVEVAWKKCAALLEELDPESRDLLELQYESRLSEIGGR